MVFCQLFGCDSKKSCPSVQEADSKDACPSAREAKFAAWAAMDEMSTAYTTCASLSKEACGQQDSSCEVVEDTFCVPKNMDADMKAYFQPKWEQQKQMLEQMNETYPESGGGGDGGGSSASA